MNTGLLHLSMRYVLCTINGGVDVDMIDYEDVDVFTVHAIGLRESTRGYSDLVIKNLKLISSIDIL